MSGFCYYIPGRLTPDQVYERGLPCLSAADGSVCCREVTSGPDKRPGTLVWHDFEGLRPWKYFASDRWVKADGYWICYRPDSFDLACVARKNLHAGKKITLGLYKFLVPIVRMLPQQFVWGSSGVELRARDEYQDLFQRCGQYLGLLAEPAKNPTIDDFWLFELVADLLSLNYRITRIELGLLGCVDTESCLKVLDVAVDLEAIVSANKKKVELEGSSNDPSFTNGEEGA